MNISREHGLRIGFALMVGCIGFWIGICLWVAGGAYWWTSIGLFVLLGLLSYVIAFVSDFFVWSIEVIADWISKDKG